MASIQAHLERVLDLNPGHGGGGDSGSGGKKAIQKQLILYYIRRYAM